MTLKLAETSVVKSRPTVLYGADLLLLLLLLLLLHRSEYTVCVVVQRQVHRQGQGRCLSTTRRRRRDNKDKRLITLLRCHHRRQPSTTGSLGHWVMALAMTSSAHLVVMVTLRVPVRCTLHIGVTLAKTIVDENLRKN